MSRDICIIGGGAVGSTLAYFLYRAGVTDIPVYFGREETVKAVLREKGVRVYDKVENLDYIVPIIPRHYSSPIDKCRFILNTVKAYSVPETLRLMERIMDVDGVIVMLQNGIGSLELAEERFGARVAGGVVYFGAERVSPVYTVYHGGRVVIAGCRHGLCMELAELNRVFKLGGLEFRIVSNIDYYRWLKLALNAVVNPLTAISRSRNSIVLSRPGLELASLILAEFIEVAGKHGFRFELNRLLEYVANNVRSTGDNYSSMAQDVLNKSPTEIDFINGFIAKELGRESSINKIITLMIHLIEESNRSRNSVQ
ncbi:MAG: 2-dehydropantoate 2-reductase [Desulfurococcus sp.]|jgi:2-dehydropantoate 2-reductase|uniref:ketopantoate reductase family protein n=1 Tax=Desulfurococcus sp. TaxID=51678 RepID=UPI00315E1F44